MTTDKQKRENHLFCQLYLRGKKKGWKEVYVFHAISSQLRISVEECRRRFQHLRIELDRLDFLDQLSQLEAQIESLQKQIMMLQGELQQALVGYKQMEAMLFEQNQLLIRLMGEEHPYLRIHSG
ncbi:hypothetical protein SAMN05444392_102454 [Seinonella peptonophila]|uniref:Uncharacterized protein n=1 Tax=Seinonella peptonophila TaxID=112248 RepID=A0A1M4VNV7_9BACL|nr:hypothetical protein [Seinonella peptonophila]SHE70608.1 hypothetical protein SAMN05444392_102454 [Seinonella peptonophila]